MPTEVLMPALSPTMEEGTLAKWLVKEGDEVSSGDLLAEIETDKATMEFEAVDEGTVGKILVEEGTEGVAVNTPIAVLLGDGESEDDIDVSASDGSGGSNGKDEHVEPSGASEATEPAQGHGRSGPQDEAAKASDAGKQAANGRDTDLDERKAPAAPTDDDGNRIFASPLARRIADQKGVDLTSLTGSGPHGRIVKADVEAAEGQSAETGEEKPTKEEAREPEKAPTAASQGPSLDEVKASFEGRSFEEVKLYGMRKTVAKRLTQAKQTIPHFYLRRDAALDELLSFRKDLNAKLEPRGVKLSVNDFIIKAAALALQEVPDANAVWAGDRMLKLRPSDVAVAVALEGGGLFTPVIRDAHHKSLSTISGEMKDLAKRARERKLGPEEYTGGTFAISNLGMFGIENFDAVINPPHGSILAIGAGAKKPIVQDDGSIGSATMMSMTLSVDHRVIDGALGAELLGAIVSHLEAPVAMLA